MAGLKEVTKVDTFSRNVLRASGEVHDERIDRVKLVEVKNRAQCKAAIDALWQSARSKFVDIGRYLVKAKAVLAHGEWDDMIEHDLPFGRSVAYTLRRIAEAIDEQKLIAEECLPGDYVTAYNLISLPSPAFEQAKQEGLIQPSVTRKQVVEFKRRLKHPAEETDAVDAQQVLAKRRSRIIAEIAKLQAELEQIERAMGPTIDIVAADAA